MLSAYSDKVVAAGTTYPKGQLNQTLDRHAERIRLNRELNSSPLPELESAPYVQKEHNSIFIPRLPSNASAMQTQWTRTNLFSNVKPGTEKSLYEHILESRKDYGISMTGRQLNMHDNDVYLHVIRLAQEQPAGQLIFFKRSEFLRALGKFDSDREYKDLLQSLKKLNSATIFITQGKKGEGFHLVEHISWDDEIGYWFTLGSPLINQFKDGISFIDLNARLKLKKPMAKWLQNYMSGHKQGSHRIAAQTLMRLSGSIGRLNDFIRRALPGALAELKAVGLINSFAIEKNKKGIVVASWDRVAHPKSRTK